MALWSKKPSTQNTGAPAASKPAAAPDHTAADAAQPAVARAASPSKPPPVPAPAAAADATKLSAEELKRRRTLSKHMSATFGEIVSMLMRQPGRKNNTLADLEWMVLPPLMANQFSVAEAQSKEQGFTAPIAVVLWARVSVEVDQRLTETLDRPIRLAPLEWTSGDAVWLIEAIGEPRALQAMLQRQAQSKWQGRTVKFRSRDKDGRIVVSTLGAAAAAPAAGA